MGFELIAGGVILVGVAVGMIAFVLSRMKVVPQTHAMIVTGSRNNDGAKVVKPGGRAFIVPVVQKGEFVPLGQINVPLQVSGVDLNKIPLNVEGVAMVKVRQDENSIRDAAERFGNNSNFEAEIGRNLQQVLTGSLRSAIAAMTVEDLLVKREVLAKNVKEATDAEVSVMGLVVDSLQVLDISDKEGYIQALGAREAEKVKAEARIATAENNKLAATAEMEAEREIAEKSRDLDLRKSQLRVETDQANAVAAAAGPREKAVQDREIAAIQQQTAEQEAILRERQLDIEVRRPADAEKYRIETEAAAYARQVELTAQAEAERVRLAGQAEADAKVAMAHADAERTAAVGKAEADAMDAKAEAYRKYGDAAIVELIIQKAPEIARELAAPLSAIQNVTLIGGSDGDGLNALPAAVANNFAQLDAVTESLTGVSIKGLVGNMGAGAAAGAVAGRVASQAKAAPAKRAATPATAGPEPVSPFAKRAEKVAKAAAAIEDAVTE